MYVQRPNLFLIGAMKAGTTYLRKLLMAHPGIFMCDPDEPSYFVDPAELRRIWPDMWRRGLWRSEENYMTLFRAARAAPILGEASTNYAKRPLVSGVAERIHAFNPEAGIVYVMRDPVKRTISHYWHMVRHHAECRPMLTAIRRDPQFLAVSYYAMQLAPFVERFGCDRVLVLTHERLVADPRATMQGVYRWLGLDAAAADASGFSQPENVTPEVISVPGWGGVLRQVRQSPLGERVASLMPTAMHQVLHQVTTRELRRRSIDVSQTVEFLRPIQYRQTEELTRMLGCPFPEWTTLEKGMA